MKKGQVVNVVSGYGRFIVGVVDGIHLKADFGGKVVAVNPTIEEYAGLEAEFTTITKELLQEDRREELVEFLQADMVIYYDLGLQRHFILEFSDVEVIQDPDDAWED